MPLITYTPPFSVKYKSVTKLFTDMSFQFNGLKALAFYCSILLLNTLLLNAAPTSVSLACPPSVIITCNDSYADLDKWGKAWIWDNYVKKFSLQPKEVIYNLNSCGIGKIIRKWEYEDIHWNWHTCSQEITIVAAGAPFDMSDITWPLSYEIEGCNPNVDPKSLPKNYNYPTFKNKSCSQPMYSFQDMKFNVSDGCMKVLRSWKVIDWCQYVPNSKNTNGIWTYTQVIKISAKDSSAKIICPKDTVLMAFTECDSAYVKLDSAFGSSKCGALSKITNNSPFSISKGANASGKYPLGTTSFYFYGEYGCGQHLSCKVTVTVVNKIGPTPYCLTGLIVALMPVDADKDGIPEDGMIEVWAKDLDHGSFSKCGNKDLKLSFSSDVKDRSKVFTCADLGKNEVQIWVTDQYGNQSYCRTNVEVQNNNARIPNCKRDSLKGGNIAMSVLNGNLLAADQSLTEEASLQLYDLNSWEINETKTTIITTKYDTIIGQGGTVLYVQKNDTSNLIKKDTLGNKKVKDLKLMIDNLYSFKDIPSNKSYKLLPIINQNTLKGINSEDVIELLRYSFGINKITDPLKKIAADVNFDGRVNYSDFDLLYSVINGNKKLSDIPKLWRFIPKSYDLAHYPKGLQEYNMYQPLIKDQSNQDFFAIKIGNLSKVNNVSTNVNSRNQRTVIGSTSSQTLIKDENNKLTIHLNSNVSALKFNTKEILKFSLNDRNLILDENTGIFLSRNGESFDHFSIIINPLKNMEVTEFEIQSLVSTIEGANLEIKSGTQQFVASIFPNPTMQSSTAFIQYSQLSANELEFRLYASNGKCILSKIYNNLYESGDLELSEIENVSSGLYYYSIINNKQIISGKLNIIEQ